MRPRIFIKSARRAQCDQFEKYNSSGKDIGLFGELGMRQMQFLQEL
jgi:hypothetical protein